jgi:hypothetical protein
VVRHPFQRFETLKWFQFNINGLFGKARICLSRMVIYFVYFVYSTKGLRGLRLNNCTLRTSKQKPVNSELTLVPYLTRASQRLPQWVIWNPRVGHKRLASNNPKRFGTVIPPLIT